MRRFGKGRKNFGYVSRFNCKPLLFNVFHSNFLIFVYETSVLMVTSKTFRDAPRINMYHEYTAFFHLPIFFFFFLHYIPFELHSSSQKCFPVAFIWKMFLRNICQFRASVAFYARIMRFLILFNFHAIRLFEIICEIWQNFLWIKLISN